MYGSYANVDDYEDESVSGSFNIASLVDSSRKYKRRLGSVDRGGAKMPVRIGSLTKPTAPARRFLGATRGMGAGSDFHRKMSDILDEEDEEKEEESKPIKKEVDVSLSEVFLDSLRLDTPAGRGRSKEVHNEGREEPLPGHEKVSPDSGSFTMTHTETHSGEQREVGVDFTENLPERSWDRPVRMGRGAGGAPVRMNFGPGRVNQDRALGREMDRSLAREDRSLLAEREQDRFHAREQDRPHAREQDRPGEQDRPHAGEQDRPHAGEQDRPHAGEQDRPHAREQDKENLPHHSDQWGAKPKQLPPQRTSSTSRIRERLQVLSGSHTNTAPLPHLQSTPTMPPQTTVKPVLPPPVTNAAPLPPQHTHTPLPSANPALTMRRDPTMPPPSMAISQESKEHVLVVKGKRYKVMKLLGKGGSSRVYEAFDEEKRVVVAIKRVDLSDADEAQTAGYVNEISMLSKLQGEDRIVKLYDHEKVDVEDILYVILEKGDTDLANLLKKYSNNREITPAMIKHYWTEMLHAVSVIHKRGVIHKDLKPANFLLVAGRLKLIDFGIASSVQSDKTSVFIDNQMGTFNFMSPESIQDLNGPQFDNMGIRKPCIKISYKSDVWSLGCILYQLTYGKMPFGDIKHPLMKLQAITNVDHPIQYPTLQDEDPVLISVIKSCLLRDPRARPSIAELLNHSYVTGQEVVEDAGKKFNAVNAVKMLAALEGVLSPNTFNKTREGMTAALRKGGEGGEADKLNQFRLHRK
eukprot:GFUD01001083.1.p1 GENE.GFUD01001083.1~~GFUD01001083.1.p1  ORF type:complete len:775 (-),score=244.53 GFUD01001083.1:238-2484(-)